MSEEPRSEVLVMRITPTLKQVLEQKAASDQRTLSGMAYALLHKALMEGRTA